MVAVRWVARMTGLLIAMLVLGIAVGHGVNLQAFAGIELAMLAALAAAVAGMLLLWKWEGSGGLLVLAGTVAFYALNLAAAGKFPGGWVFPLCFVPGVLGLVCWWNARKHDGERRA